MDSSIDHTGTIVDRVGRICTGSPDWLTDLPCCRNLARRNLPFLWQAWIDNQ